MGCRSFFRRSCTRRYWRSIETNGARASSGLRVAGSNHSGMDSEGDGGTAFGEGELGRGERSASA